MIDFSISNDKYENDLMELIRAFEQRTDENFSVCVNYENKGEEFVVSVSSNKFDNFQKIYRYQISTDDEMEQKRLEKRYLKQSIYGVIVFLTGINLPYGCLTGIRPTKLYVELKDDAHDKFSHDFSVSGNKIELIEKIVDVQRPLRNHSEKEFDVFVFIPFCPTRCAYCSFVSVPIDKQKKLIEPYVDCLLSELEFVKEVVRTQKIKVRAVYVGGGTPTSIPANLLEKILKSCLSFKAKEFTVEAGRPDTITDEIIAVLKKCKVTRISINPQTFNDKTLQLIGRKHTAAQVEEVYEKAKGKFDVNMDLIAMLPDESFDDFKYTVDKAVELNSENITVHTLYLKKGSALKVGGYKATENDVAEQMVDYAYKKLTASGYEPYYMYRQKYTSGNLENVGYAKKGKACIYNIDIMEEDTSILAAGANAISKKWTESINLIERNANFKEPLEYVNNFDTVMARQKAFWLKDND